jgi:hypothetical protein
MIYYKDVMQKMIIPKDEKLVYVIDCLFVHKSNGFLSWMKFEFLFICVISIFINYISKLQWTNVIVRQPLTCKVTKRIKKLSTSCRQEQLEFGALEVKLYLSIGTLHENYYVPSYFKLAKL